MDYWTVEYQSMMERKRTIYRSPLPRKKQLTSSYKSGRPCKVKVYTKEEIENYERSRGTSILS